MFRSSLIVLFVLLLSTVSHSKEQSSKELCFQTFNAYGPWYAPNLEKRTEYLKEYLLNNPCDVLLFQEVWLDEHVETLKVFLEKSGYQVFHFDHISLKGKKYGLLTGVKGQIEGQGFFEFSHNYEGIMDSIREYVGVGKGAGLLKVKLDNYKKQLFIVNIHLHHSEKELRLKQAIELVDKVKELNKENLEVVIGGDFNFEPGSEENQILSSSFVLAEPKNTCTYCKDNDYSWTFSDRQIDKFYLSREMGIKISKFTNQPKMWKDQYMSDHSGLRVFLQP